MLKVSFLASIVVAPVFTLAQALGPGAPPAAEVARASGAPSPRTTVTVDCSNPRAPVRTIADGLRMLGDSRPAVLLVSGTCRENVTIQGLDRITLRGNPLATIDGGLDPAFGTVEIVDAASIDLVDLTITGGGEGLGCVQCSARATRVTIQGSLGLGATTDARSLLLFTDSSIRDNADVGVLVGNAATVKLVGTSVSRNGAGGVFLNAGTTLILIGSQVEGNAGHGIDASLRATVVLNGSTVSDNAAEGLNLQGGSAVRVARSRVAGNAGHQVRIGDLSFASFSAASTVGGGTFPEVACDGAFASTRGVSTLLPATSNCPAEPAHAP